MSAKIPHVHAAVIKAWADGAQIQYRKDDSFDWAGIDKPSWLPDYQYRVKPEPKPDINVVKHYYVCANNNIYVDQLGEFKTQPVKYVIDGETRLIKSVELIK